MRYNDRSQGKLLCVSLRTSTYNLKKIREQVMAVMRRMQMQKSDVAHLPTSVRNNQMKKLNFQCLLFLLPLDHFEEFS